MALKQTILCDECQKTLEGYHLRLDPHALRYFYNVSGIESNYQQLDFCDDECMGKYVKGLLASWNIGRNGYPRIEALKDKD